MVIRVSVDLRRIVGGDMIASHLHSQVNCGTSVNGINVFLVADPICDRNRDVIGRLSVNP